MVIALLSDLHSNLEPLEASVKHAETNGARRYAFLGHLVGDGADPDEIPEGSARDSAADPSRVPTT